MNFTDNEQTINDSYLILNESNLENKKISYRKNLIEFFEKDAKMASELSGIHLDQIEGMRKLVRIAAEHGYRIYQLTQL